MSQLGSLIDSSGMRTPSDQGPPPIAGATHHRIEVNGFLLNYAEAGDGEPVLLLHGWPQHHGMWSRVIPMLSERFRVIAPDLRGFGWSETPGYGYNGPTFARDQVALMDALGIESAQMIGHDWGGWTAMLLAIDHPARVRRMIVCNCPHPWPKMSAASLRQLWRSWYACLIATPGMGPKMLRDSSLVNHLLTQSGSTPRFGAGEAAAYADSFRDPRRAEAISSLYRYYLSTFREAALGGSRGLRIEAPTQLLFGVNDRMISHYLLEIDVRGQAPNMEVEMIPDAAHFIVDEQPELIADRAGSFFS